MKLSNIDEATRVVQEILNMEIQKVITKKQAIAAIKKVDYYKDILAAWIVGDRNILQQANGVRHKLHYWPHVDGNKLFFWRLYDSV